MNTEQKARLLVEALANNPSDESRAVLSAFNKLAQEALEEQQKQPTLAGIEPLQTQPLKEAPSVPPGVVEDGDGLYVLKEGGTRAAWWVDEHGVKEVDVTTASGTSFLAYRYNTETPNRSCLLLDFSIVLDLSPSRTAEESVTQLAEAAALCMSVLAMSAYQVDKKVIEQGVDLGAAQVDDLVLADQVEQLGEILAKVGQTLDLKGVRR